ncbi:hypothetical protein A374_07814 [Fictibacillus macauensis ZFHKF-1]|uniref:ATP-grasp domain-containing protein n=1 Tax=Fictibacillus macauensis ZFHKF-1 TaxID=1196324 RepID=I8AJL6_9BACL|nr:ATP-grasp domain-containing protein [Fictibacillus macauensis]EIT85724.1 hypothetical protein A374_07814 [Fictibacillus macauensis ZFHKF-1]
MSNLVIKPSLSFSDIYGTDVVYNPRPSFSHHKWIPDCPVKMDLLTGSQLAVLGSMPTICNVGVVSQRSLSLYNEAGLEIEAPRYEYTTENEYRALLASFAQKQKKAVVQHIHPEGELSFESYWIDPKLVQYLNNKANLSELVPQGDSPKRLTVQACDVIQAKKNFPFPFVLKAATNEANAAGFDVWICHDEEEFQRAHAKFAADEELVIEEYLNIEKNYCVQFASHQNGDLTYLGTALQNIDEKGKYKGNWIGEHAEPARHVIEMGKAIMKEGVKKGYRGIAGIDIAVTDEGRAVAFDLNFRVNGSTAALLLKDSINEQLGATEIKYVSWKSHNGMAPLYDLLQEGVANRLFIPLSIYDGNVGIYNPSDSLVQGLLLGSSEHEIAAIEKKFTQAHIY